MNNTVHIPTIPQFNVVTYVVLSQVVVRVFEPVIQHAHSDSLSSHAQFESVDDMEIDLGQLGSRAGGGRTTCILLEK